MGDFEARAKLDRSAKDVGAALDLLASELKSAYERIAKAICKAIRQVIKDGDDLQSELEALRRELRQIPVMEEADAAAPSDARAEIEKVLHDLKDRLGEATEEAEDIVAAHPLASVAAAFLLGMLVANLMSRGQ